MRVRGLIWCCPVLLSATVSVRADWEVVSTFGGRASVPVDIGEYFIYTEGSTFTVVDRRRPFETHAVARLELPEQGDQTLCTGGLAAVCGYRQYHLVDISSPEVPVFRSTVDFGPLGELEEVHDVALTDSCLTVVVNRYQTSDAWSPLAEAREIDIDVRDPSHPVTVSERSFASALDVEASGEFLFTLNNRQFRVHDMSDPVSPVLVSELAVTRGVPFLVDWPCAYLKWQLLDVSDVQSPHMGGSVTSYTGIWGNLALGGGTLVDQEYREAFHPPLWDVSYWDVTDPMAPVRFHHDSSSSTDIYRPIDGATHEGWLIVRKTPTEYVPGGMLDDLGGWTIEEVTRTSPPVFNVQDRLDVPGGVDAALLDPPYAAVFGDYAFLYDLSDPDFPRVIGASDQAAWNPTHILRMGDSLIAVGPWVVHAFDLAAPPDLPLLSAFVPGGSVKGSAVSGELLALSTSTGTQLWDFSAPSSPERLATISRSWPIISFAPGHLLLASDNSIEHWDISEPRAPARAHVITVPEWSAEAVAADLVILSQTSPDGSRLSLRAMSIAGDGSPELGATVDFPRRVSHLQRLPMSDVLIQDRLFHILLSGIEGTDQSTDHRAIETVDFADIHAPRILDSLPSTRGPTAAAGPFLATAFFGSPLQVYRHRRDHPSAERIVRHLLGWPVARDGLDVIGDGQVNASDLVARLEED